MASLPTPGVTTDWGDDLNAAIESLHLGPDTHANRPTTNLTTGTLYSCTDHNLIYRWSGSTWATYATLGGGSAWTQVVDLPGSSLTGVTSAAGTWSSDGTNITQSVASTSTDNQRLRIDTLVDVGMLVFQADIRVTSTAGADNRAGLVVGWTGQNTNPSFAMAARVHLNSGTANTCDIEVDQNAARFSKAIAWGGLNVWKTLRLVVGGNTGTLYLDGVALGSAVNANTSTTTGSYVGLFTGGCAADFRNIRAWNLTHP